jgi:flagellar biosynthesis chaperone FliJ
MSADPLRVLARVRRLALDEARRRLADCLAAEDAAATALAAIDAEIGREREAAMSLAADDAAVESFAVWLPEARRRADQAEAVLARASAETHLARAAVSATRGAYEAVEHALQRRAEVQRSIRTQAEQRALDEVASRRADTARGER